MSEATGNDLQRPSRWRALATSLALLLGGMAVGYGSARLTNVEGLDFGWVELVSLPLIIFGVIAVHELGHLLAGMSRGMPPLLYLVGPLRVTFGAEPEVAYNRSLATWGGLAACQPIPEDDFPERLRFMVAGGPLASLGLALLGAILAFALQAAGWDLARNLAGITAATSLMIFLVTVLPFQSGGFQSDGAQWLALGRRDRETELRCLLASLTGQSMSGTRPRDLDPDLLERVIQGSRRPELRTAAASLALSAAMDRGDAAMAERMAALVADGLTGYPAGFRQGLMLDLAWHEATAGNPDVARDWLRQAGKGGFTEPHQRQAAEAAIAAAEGDEATARQAAGEALARLPRALDQGGAAALRDALENWA
jgi:hypothetical protein